MKTTAKQWLPPIGAATIVASQLLIACGPSPSRVSAQVREPARVATKRPLVFRAAMARDPRTDLKQWFRPERDAMPLEVLTGGRDFPATFFAEFEGGFCSATLVGGETALTAAHCLANREESVHFEYGADVISADCEQYSHFDATGNRKDWAMCALTKTIPATGDMKYESLNTSFDLVKVGDTLLVTGFGAGQFLPRQVLVVTPPTPSDERIVLQGRTLSGGDSGGSSFRYFGASYSSRVEVAVNSTVLTATTDALAHLGSDAGLDFLRTWSNAHPSNAICGATTTATTSTGCRNAAPPGATMVR